MAEGHRARLKKRFLTEGLENFEPHNTLELLLFYAIPRVDTNPIAHRLIDRFGSVSAVLDASVSELSSVDGVGENAAIFLKLIGESYRYLDSDTDNFDKLVLDDEERISKYLIGAYRGVPNEVVMLLMFDAKRRLIETCRVHEGSVSSAGVNIRKLAELALEKRAVSVILAHNHPGGLAFPSADDIAVTTALHRALVVLEIQLVSHYIIAGGEYITFGPDISPMRPPKLSVFQ